MAGTYIQWVMQDNPGSSGITLVSAWTMMQQLAQVLHTFCDSMAQDRWWPADGPAPDPGSVLSYELPNDVRYMADAPGLSVRVRVTWQLDPDSPEPQRFLLVEFDTPPQYTAEAWEQARSARILDQWDALQKTKKFLTLHVRCGDQYEAGSPQDKALWQALKLQEGLRTVDRAHRNPASPSPREALVQVLEQGLQHPATNSTLRYEIEKTLVELGARPPDWDPRRGMRHLEGLRSVDYGLPPNWEHQPLSWLPIWIEPGITTLDDTMFELVLRLLQWHMLESTLEINRFLDRYLGQFKDAFTKDERHLLRQGHTLGGGAEFAALLRTDAYPESAKGRRQYFARTFHGHRATAARQAAEQSGQWLTASPRSDGPYSVDDAVGILAREASPGSWTPPRDWLYDRIKAAELLVVYDTQGRKRLDENGLQSARKLVKDENVRRTLVAYQMDTLGKSRRAANKFIQEHEARGESLEDIARALLSQQRGSHT